MTKPEASSSVFNLAYAAAPETASPVPIKNENLLYIGGQWVEPADGECFTTYNPATGLPLAQVALAGSADVDRAVLAATQAAPAWALWPGSERAKVLYRIARILQERARAFAVLETMDCGKPIKESRDFDLPQAAAHFFYYAGWADKLPYAFGGQKYRPHGVTAQIIPSNAPLLMTAWKLAPALATGNTVVLKPAETAPLSTLALVEILEEAGVPPGVVNVLTGPGSTGSALVGHRGINKVAFTGSTLVGKQIQRDIADRETSLTLELGGKGTNIVFDDAAFDQAVEGVVNGSFTNQGHVGSAGSRLLVQESIAGHFLARLKDRISTLRVGDPLDKNTDIGAINSKEQLQKIIDLVAVGLAEGAELYQPDVELPQQGWFYRPSVFTNVALSHRVANEETFGPVLSVLTFRTAEEALTKANNTVYGLSAGVWTEKGSRILWMADRLRAGVVWANTFNRFDPTSPFGGVKESGFGRTGGRVGLLAYVELSEMFREH